MKKIFLMLALFSAVVTANAQIATENSNALDNIGVGVTAGVSTPLDFNSVFPLNTNVGLKITKDFTPVVGLQAEGIAILNDNHFSDLKTAVKATNVGLNGVVNLSNLFFDYKGSPRVFEVSAVAGLGWFHNWKTTVNHLTSKTGLDFAFNIGKKKAHSIVLTPAVYWNLTGNYPHHKVQFNKNFAQLALNLSYIYHFKTSNGTHHFKTWDVGAMNDEITRLQGALDECNAREPITRTVEVPVEKEVLILVNDQWFVEFAKGDATLDDAQKIKLNAIPLNMTVNVVGYASPEGNATFNQTLSEKRAAEVALYLSERGITINRIVGDGVAHGDNTNRLVVVTAVH